MIIPLSRQPRLPRHPSVPSRQFVVGPEFSVAGGWAGKGDAVSLVAPPTLTSAALAATTALPGVGVNDGIF